MNKTNDTVEFPNRLTSGFMQRFCPDIFATYNLVEMYNKFNAYYFDSELPELPLIEVEDVNGEIRHQTNAIQWDGRFRRVYGKYYLNTKQIRLAKHMAYNHSKVKSTLLHEMLHKYLDLRGEDDGIEGHGPNFIRKAKEINDRCREYNVDYRVEFYDREITVEDPAFHCELLGTEIACFKDLDLARKIQKVVQSAFHDKWSYHQ